MTGVYGPYAKICVVYSLLLKKKFIRIKDTNINQYEGRLVVIEREAFLS
jgi:hypothetical protein